MICFFHKSDYDGICSAAIVKNKYPKCIMVGVDYTDNWHELMKEYNVPSKDTIFIVDFSFNREAMNFLNLHHELIWIDHHKSAIKECAGLKIKGNSVEGLAGCELTWMYLNTDVKTGVCKKIPTAVNLLGRYDVWDNSDKDAWNELILPFQYGMKFINLDCTNGYWKELFADNMQEIELIIEKGRICMEYQKQQNKIACGNSFELDFKGYKAIVMNSTTSNSQLFESIWDESKYDIMIVFKYVKNSWVFSIYSTKNDVDASEIAKEYGGGGHKGAAGFVCDTIYPIIKI